MRCELVVTLLDVLFGRTISQTLLLQVNTSLSLMMLNTEMQYLPLAQLTANVILVRHSAAADVWRC